MSIMAANSGCAMVCSSIRSVKTLVMTVLSPRFIAGRTIPVSQNDAAKIGSIGPLTAILAGVIFSHRDRASLCLANSDFEYLWRLGAGAPMIYARDDWVPEKQ